MTVGQRGERYAADYLKQHGFRILDHNYHCRYGEVDLVAEDATYLVFVEVKTRSGTRFGTPAQAVTAEKQRKLTITAQRWLMTHETQRQPRFDVIEVYVSHSAQLQRVVHIPNAFEAME